MVVPIDKEKKYVVRVLFNDLKRTETLESYSVLSDAVDKFVFYVRAFLEFNLDVRVVNIFKGCQRAENVAESDSERIDKSVDSKESKIYASQKLAKFFELEVTLKVFGKVIWTWVFPPKN